jgi:CheY-like chemotaxis protein
MGRGRLVLAGVDDLFFSTRIASTAEALGVRLVLAADAVQLENALAASTPDLIILDLNSRTCAPLEAIRRIKADPRLTHSHVLGFLSHVQVELERSAAEAGCDVILPRSKFSAGLAQILAGEAQGRRGGAPLPDSLRLTGRRQ